MGSPSVPEPPPPPELPPPPPNELDPAVKARRERFRQQMTVGGRRSTILTTPQGLPTAGNITGRTLLGGS